MHVKIVNEKTVILEEVDSGTFSCSLCDKKYPNEVSLKQNTETHRRHNQVSAVMIVAKPLPVKTISGDIGKEFINFCI